MIVVWRVTERCNLACPFCAYDRRVVRPRFQSDGEAVRSFGPVLAQYREQTGRPVLVSWIGGEPLRWPRVFALSRWLRRANGVRISATTNGSTLHLPAVRRRIVDDFAELTVSVDGDAAYHDAMRGRAGLWARIRAGVLALAERRAACAAPLRLRANVVLMSDNIDQFPALCSELADWGCDEITFNQLGGRDRPEFFPEHRLQGSHARAITALMPALQASLAARGVTLCASPQYLARIEASAQGQALAVPDCGGGQRFLFIDEAERVAPCNFTSDDFGILLSTLRSADDLLALPARYASLRRAPACADCPSTQVFAKFVS